MKTLNARLRPFKAALSSNPEDYRSGPPCAPSTQDPKGHVLYHYSSAFDAEALIQKYEDQERVADPDYITNFLGVKIDESPLPEVLTKMKGSVEGLPNPGNWHADIVEWGSALKAIDEADTTFRAIEVGCGWGCWLNNLGVTAKRAGLKIDLTGIEGSAHHLKDARRLLRLNGIEDTEARLVHGVAAEKTDRALFPLTGEGVYGAEPVFFPDDTQYTTLMAGGGYEELPTYTLAQLSGENILDLMHIDIQGSELAFVDGNWNEISQLVRRIFIGTHGRVLDGGLMNHFLQKGWVLEAERPSVEFVQNGKPTLSIDGAQLWRNPAL